MKTALRFWRACVGSLLVLLFPVGLSAQVVINEVLADNGNAYNNDGDNPDYVELYNNNNFTVDLTGWRIGDSGTNYTFRQGTTIDAKGFLLVFCDNNNQSPGIHTGFGLSDTEDRVTLWNAGGVLRDEIRFGFQVRDRSIGRVPDFSGAFVLCRPTPEAANVPVPLGARASLRINEWMPVAANSSGTVTDDWFEIYNTDLTNDVNLSLMTIRDSGETNPPLPQLSFIGAGAYLQFLADGNIENGIDHVSFSLSSSSGDSIGLYAPNGTLLHRVNFGRTVATNTSQGWLPDGNAGWNGVTNTATVRLFPGNRATPGDSNFLPIENVLINEVIAHTDPPLEDAIELYNPTGTPVDISGWWLSNSKDNHAKYRIPNGTVIPAFGYKVFYEYWDQASGGFNSTGLPLAQRFTLNSAHGDQVYLFIADAAGTLTGYRRGVDFPASENGVSFGRYILSTGESDFVPMRRLTFGTDVTREDPPSQLPIFRTGAGQTNASPKFGPLVVNEIMYHPPDTISGTNRIPNVLDEFVEIYNASVSTVHLYDTNIYWYNNNARTNTWRVRGEADFDFPTNMTMSPGESIVLVNFNPYTNTFQSNIFFAKYQFPLGTRLFGPYGGSLSDGGGDVEIERPDAPQIPGAADEGFVPYLRVDKVNYNDRAPWPTQPDGNGYSLVRIVPEHYGGDPINWRAEQRPNPGRQPLSITSIQRSGAGSVIIRFNGLAGSGYSILGSQNLSTWSKVQDIAPAATSGQRQATIPSATPAYRFFRVVTPIRP